MSEKGTIKIFVLVSALVHVFFACSFFPTPEKARQMRAILEEAEAQNRAYIPFTTDTLLQQAADYFDSYGTANEQLKAHYLLGCVYRDLGEAPHALQCYYDAIEKVDTLSPDCDYNTLLAVYGQMGDLYNRQNLPHDELSVLQKYHYYASRINDTLKILRNYELMVGPYELLGDTEQILNIEKTVHQLYEKYGYHQEAVASLSSTICIYINRGRLEEAKNLMQKYENESGLFDKNGNIGIANVGYYYFKGNFFYLLHQYDSAEYYYRKDFPLLYKAYAYHGLLSIFRDRNIVDSVYKYSSLLEVAFDSLRNEVRTETMHQMASLYNYSRHQQLAEKRKQEILTIRWVTGTLFFGVLLIIVVIVWRYRVYSIRQRKKLQEVTHSYNEVWLKYKKAISEFKILQEEQSALIVSKREEIDSLKEQITDYYDYFTQLKQQQKTAALLDSEIVNTFKNKAKGKLHEPIPNEEEWNSLISLFSQCMPIFYNSISASEKLSQQEQRVCILIRLLFAEGEIAVLMNTSIQRVTNIKARVNKKLFGEEKAITLIQHLKKIW